jgi:broad specificity phosphatase PhoE
MILKSSQVSRVLLVRPGATDFDDQGRMKGSLDMPLSSRGREQVTCLTEQVSAIRIKTIYTAPCASAIETAQQMAKFHRQSQGHDVRVKVIDAFRNVDHGLWHGKLIEEVKRNLPRVYRQGQEAPDDLCPPKGESIRDARARVVKAVRKVLRGSREDVIAIVIPDPMAWVVEGLLCGTTRKSLWDAETDSAKWELIDTVL